VFKRHLAHSSLALGLISCLALPSRSELFKNLKIDGSIETRSFGIDNETDRNGNADDYRSETRTRLLGGASFDLLDDVHSRVLLRKNNRLHGQGVENVNSVQTALALDNAYVKIDKIFGHVDLTVGRQFYGHDNDLVIYYGVNDDDILSVSSLDLFRADANLGSVAHLTAIGGKINETTPVSATAPPAPTNVNSDTDLFGGEVNSDKLIPMGNLAGYYYTRKIKGAGVTANDTMNIWGLHAAGDILAGLGYDAEYAQNTGRNNSIAATPAYHGNAYSLGLGYKHEYGSPKGAMPIRAHADYGRGSRDFTSVSSGRRYGKIWGEHTSVGPSTALGHGGTGLTDLKVFDAGAGFNCPVTKIGFDLNWYRFMYDHAQANGKSSAGSELDLILSYKHSENVYLEASWARFWVGDALQNAPPTPTSPVTRLGGDLKIKF
jgi:hypothetical protein